MKGIAFLNDPQSYNPEGAFVVHISGVSGKEELLKELSVKLMFPDNFSFNWDALFDCVRDFEWIKQKNIILIHDKLPALDSNELKIYIEILSDSVKDWKEFEKKENKEEWEIAAMHRLEVVFPGSVKDLICEYIRCS